ncbi:hypothetical protein D0T49_01780 [Paludibacter sp. 221]|uniref:hypothetical protein n=1 Tax=Paludibacter sp. 221 TaxID=2302939 RepID=UPI0013D4C090|nr:hypothetical protein [Paludibacter sp. 221]NDV45781.1 hypothetical protein [Paludibacter sp. 221]
MTIREKIIRTLHQAASELEQLHDDWYVFGSAASILLEVELENTTDIDIVTSGRDAELLKTLWHTKNLHVDSKPSELFCSDLSRYHFELLDIEISGNLEVYRNNKWQKFTIYDYEVIPVGKLLVKIPTLQEQKNILHFFGREKDLQKIKLIDKRIAETEL